MSDLRRWQFSLRHHDIVLCLTLRGGVHRGHAHEIVLFGVELDRWFADLGRESGKSGFALGVGIEPISSLCAPNAPMPDGRRMRAA